MGVFKATKNASTAGVFKATKNRSYDSAFVSRLEDENRESSSRLNDYITRRQADEWMSEDDIQGYRDALDRYRSSSKALSDFGRTFGSYNDEDEKQRTSYIDSIAADLDSSSSMFKSYKNADEYGAAVSAYKEREAMKTASLDDISSEITALERKLASERQKIGSDSALSWYPDKAKDFFAGTNITGIQSDLDAKRDYYNKVKEVQDYENHTAAELYKLADEAAENTDSLYWRNLANRRDVQEKSNTLAGIRMDGERVTVLEALNDLSSIEDGNSRRQREKAIKNKMASLGLDFDDYYSRITGEGNFSPGDAWKWAKSALLSGTASWNKGISSTADLILGKPLQALGWEKNPISAAADYYSDSYNNYAFDRSLYASKMGGGKALDYAGQFVEGVVSAVPDAILAGMTAGASAGVGLTNGGLAIKAAYQSGDKLTKAGLTIEGMMKNPNYWSSFARTYGLDYEEAKASGASDTAAALGATITSLINAGIEIGFDGGSGFQGLAQDLAEGGRNKFWAWAESSLEEGGEEILQGFVNNLVSKVMYDDSTELANIEQMIAEGGMGVAVGAALGGGEVILRNAANSAVRNQEIKKVMRNFTEFSGKSIVEGDTVRRLVESAGTLGNTRAEQKLKALAESIAGVDPTADGFSQKSKSRLEKSAGKLYRGLVEAKGESFENSRRAAISDGIRKELEVVDVKDIDRTVSVLTKYAVGDNLTKSEKALMDMVGGKSIVERVMKSGVDENTARAYADYNSSAALPFVSREDTELGGKKHVDVRDRVSSTGYTVKADTGENITVNKENAIDRIENGEAYINTDKGTVKLSNIEFANENEARLYESFLDYDSATASALIKNYDGGISVERYVNGMRQGINVYGKYNFQGVGIDISKDSFFADLSPTDQRYALNIGRSIARAEAQAAQTAVAAKTAAKTRGKVQFAEGVTAETKAQKNGVALAKHLASALGINITFFDSTKDVQHRNDNGWYDPATDSIHLDINAGDNHEGTIAYTLGHELTHYIKKWSPEKFKVFGDFLVEQYGKHGISTQEMLEAQMAKLNTTDEAIAYEEMVADACQTMLLDSNAVEKLIQLRQQDKGLFEKIKEFIHNILAKLRKDYTGIDPNSDEAKALRSMTDVVEQMSALFEDAAVDAAQAHSQAAEGRQTGEVKYQKRSTAGIEPQDVEQLRSIGRKSVNEFTGAEIQKTEKWARKFYRELGTKSPFFRAWFGDWRAQDTTPIIVADTIGQERGTVRNKDTQWDIQVSGQVFSETNHNSNAVSTARVYLPYINSIVQNAVLLDTVAIPSGKEKSANSAWMHSLYAVADIGNVKELLKLYVEELNDVGSDGTIRRAYQLQNIENQRLSAKGSGASPLASSQATADVRTISDLFSVVNSKDKNFHPKPVSKALLNADGTPKAFYHGTADEITQFVSEKRGSNTEAESAKLAFFFTDSETVASGYAADARPEWIEDLRKKAERLDSRAQITGKFAEAEAAYSAYEEAEIAYDSSGIVMPVYISLQNPYVYDFKGQEYREKTYYDIIKKAQEAGNDGVVFQNTYDASNNATDEMNTVCAVFNSADIKSTDNIGTFDGSNPDIRYSKRVTDKKTLEFLNGQETVTTYKAMQLIDGKLYPPMAAKVKGADGKYHLTNPSEIGVWQEAVEDPAHIKVKKNGIGYYTLNKGNGKSIDAAYNPYEHSSNLVLNDQFEEAYQRENIVTVECVIPKSELSGEYKAEFAKDSTGMLDWKSGVVAGKLKDNKRKVYLSRWLKPVRILSDAETAAMYKKVIGNDISVPFNVVTPGLRAELEKLGVIIDYEGTPGYKAHHRGKDSTQPKFSKRSSNERYTYDALVSKPDMPVTELKGTVPGNRADVLYVAKRNAAKIGKFNPKDGSVSVHVDDIDADVVLGSNGLKHSLDRRFSINAPVTLQAGAILRNSIQINELTPQKSEVSGSYVLVGAAMDGNGELYVVRSVVNKYSSELTSMDVLYAINAKKGESAALKAPRSTTMSLSVTDSTKRDLAALNAPRVSRPRYQSSISISTLLDFVNQYFPDILPEEVLKHYGHTARPEGNLGQSALYSTRNKSNRELLSEALETTIDSSTPMGQYEAKLLGQYRDNVELLDGLQAHLKEVNAEIRALTFGDAPRDPVRLRSLKDEKIKTENRIGIYDKKLLRLEATQPLKDVLEREKKRVKQETVSAFRESTKERKAQSEIKGKLKRVIKSLDQLLNHGTKERNVKADMQETVGAVLSLGSVLFNDEITNEDIVKMGAQTATPEEQKLLDKYMEYIRLRDNSEFNEARKYISKISALNSRLSELFVRERERLNRTKVADAVTELSDAYARLKNSGDDFVSFAYDSDVAGRIAALKEELGGTTVRDMTNDQLRSVYEVFRMVKHMVSTSNNLFRMGKAQSLSDTTRAVQSEVLKWMIKEHGDPNATVERVAEQFRSFGWNELKPVYAFERLGSDTYMQLFWDAINAEGVWARDVEEAKTFLDAQVRRTGYRTWDMQEAHEFRLPNGQTFKLTLQEMMSIYAYSKREQAYEHMTVGGFQFAENSEYRENGRKKLHSTGELYTVDADTIKAIIEALTPQQAAYVDAVQSYLTELGKKGNEVSRALYGIDLFTEKVYFPLMSARDYRSSVETALNATQTQASLKNTGMSKPTVPHAKNPIILQGFDAVVNKHIDTMSKYHAYVLPIENLRRVFDSTTIRSDGRYVSTKNIIKRVYGKAAMEYFENYITDLNGGTFIPGYNNPVMGMFSKFKATAVGASLSVIIQQPFAIIRAMNMISPQYFVFGKVGERQAESRYAEIKKYAPVAIIKEMGGFDMGNSRTAAEYLTTRTDKGLKRTVDTISNAAQWGAGKADELGWGIIWDAVKRETYKKGFKYGSKEFYEACGKRFTEVITYTQVYDSVNSRSGMMRSKHDSVKFATSFMGEPTTVINMAYSAVLKVQRAKGSAAKRKAFGALMRTAGVLLASALLNGAAKSFVYAGRDDDDDEAYFERWAEQFAGSMHPLTGDISPLTMLPYVKDIVSLFQGYDVERPDMTLIANVVSDIIRVIDKWDDMDLDTALSLIGDVGNLCGLPLKNIIRDTRGVVNTIGDAFDSVYPTDIGGALMRGFSGENQSNTDALYGAIVRKDSGRIEVIRNKYKTDASYETAVKRALRENDPRITEALKARVTGDNARYQQLRQQIIEEGNFDKQIVNDALKAEYDYYMKKIEEAAKLMKEGDTVSSGDIILELKKQYKGVFKQDDIMAMVKRKAGLLK